LTCSNASIAHIQSILVHGFEETNQDVYTQPHDGLCQMSRFERGEADGWRLFPQREVPADTLRPPLFDISTRECDGGDGGSWARSQPAKRLDSTCF